jgi:hypothetical protein
MATSFLPFSLSCYSIQNVSRLEPSCFQLGNFCEGERWAHTQMSVVLQNFLTVDCYGIDKKKTRQMPFFFVCLYLHNVRSYMAKIFRDEIKSPFAFSHIFLRATRWCWWRQYKNIQSLLGDVVARENIYQSASTWSCWPIINSQCWNVHFFFHSSCAAPKPSQKTVFDSISLFILSHSGMKISRPEKLAEAFQGKNWNSSEISIFHGVPFFCVSDQKHFTDLYDMQMTVSSSHANWRTAGQRQIPKSFPR